MAAVGTATDIVEFRRDQCVCVCVWMVGEEERDGGCAPRL